MFAFKIWIIASILLTAYGGLSDSDDSSCTERDAELCHPEEILYLQFPENVEALDKICPAKIASVNCLVDYHKKCDDVEEIYVERLGRIKELILEACDKDSALHQEFADNLPCIKSVMKRRDVICSPIVKEARDANQLFFKTNKSEEIEDYGKLFCLSDFFNLACFTALAGVKCGSETKEFVSRIFERVGIEDLLSCRADIREEVKQMAKIAQLEMEEKMVLAGLSDLDDDICFEEDPDLCHTNETKHVQFPGNIEALDKMCPATITRLSCLLDYKKKCGYIPWSTVGSFEAKLVPIQELAFEACDKDSALHQEFADNLPCIKSLMNDHYDICFPIIHDAVDAIKNPLFFKGEGDKRAVENTDRLMCLYVSFSHACFAARAGVKCGSETKEFVSRMLEQVGVTCQADIREEVKRMAQILQLEIEEKMALGEIFSKE